MTSRIRLIAFNTFREAVRDRVLYNLIFFALLLVASAPLFSQISIGVERLFLINLGLTAISVFGIVIAIFIGTGLVSKEIEKRTLYTILSRPVRRWEFIAGKYLGLAGTLVVNAAFMTIGFYAALWLVLRKVEHADTLILLAVYFILLQYFIVTAVALLFSSFSSPLLSAVLAFALFIAGSLAEDLHGFAETAHGASSWLITAAAYAIPNLNSLNIIARVAHGDAVSGQIVFLNTIYTAFYVLICVSVATLVFERRNLK